MAQLFVQMGQQEPPKPDFYKKRKCFQKEIRSKEIQKKINQLRIVGSDGPHIKAMVNALPSSWDDLVQYMLDHPHYQEAITKTIIDKVYHLQLSEQTKNMQNQTYFLMPQNRPKTSGQVQKVIYFFSILLQHQGIYAPNIFQRYLIILLDHATVANMLQLIFNLFIEVLKKPELNWAPIQQIVQAIKWIEKTEKTKKQNQLPVFTQEVQTYLHLTSHYYPLVERNEQIKNRIKLILEKGSDCLEPARPKLFFKLCLNLTYYENSKDADSLATQNEITERPNPSFHDAMIKGGIFKNLFRHLFFSSNEKLRHLCLQVLRNLILECGGRFLWIQQKLNPIERFQHEIKDTSNSMFLFKIFCQVFLISIVQLSRHQLVKTFQNEVDTLELILYILETVDKSSEGGKKIHEYAEESLWFMLEEGSREIQQTVMNKILQTRWKIVLGPESELVYHCQKYQKI